jgi:hypothetical protein
VLADGTIRKPRRGPGIDGVEQRNAQVVHEVQPGERPGS